MTVPSRSACHVQCAEVERKQSVRESFAVKPFVQAAQLPTVDLPRPFRHRLRLQFVAYREQLLIPQRIRCRSLLHRPSRSADWFRQRELSEAKGGKARALRPLKQEAVRAFQGLA